MTKEEAIEVIKHEHDTDLIEALEMAIKALEQQSCADAISRQAVIDACGQSVNLFEAVDRIRELPPVTPQPKTGRWVFIRMVPEIFYKKAFFDRDDFEESLEYSMADDPEYESLSDEDFEKAVKEKLEEYEPYWTDVIQITATT